MQLRLFVSLAQTMNFSKTAEYLFISQPAVSHQLKTLERRLGVQLFRRDSHNVSLTQEGMEFLDYAKQILELMASAESRVQNVAAGRAGRIRIAAVSSNSEALGECLSAYSAVCPTTQVDVDLLSGAEESEALTRGTYDFYFATERMLPMTRTYRAIPSGPDRLCLFVPRSWAERVNMSDWTTIAPLPFVSVTRADTTLSTHVDLVCSNRGFVPRIINYYNKAESIVLSVNAGVGVGIIPGKFMEYYPYPDVVALPIDGDDAKVVHIIAWNRDISDSVTLKFAQVVEALYGNAP